MAESPSTYLVSVLLCEPTVHSSPPPPHTHNSREHTRDTASNAPLPPLAATKVSRKDTVPLTRAESIGDYCRLYRKQPKGGPDFSVEGGKAGLKPIHRGGRLPVQRQHGPAILPDLG